MVVSTTSAAFSMSSCSQKRRTVQPILWSRPSVSRSRCTLRPSLELHHSEFAFGRLLCRGHACQKQPSTKMASRYFLIEISARRRGMLGSAASTRYRTPAACRSRLSWSSGLVSRAPWRDIRSETCGEDAMPTGNGGTTKGSSASFIGRRLKQSLRSVPRGCSRAPRRAASPGQWSPMRPVRT